MIIILIILVILAGFYFGSLATLSLLGLVVLASFLAPARFSRAIVLPVNLRKDKRLPNL